MSQKLIGPVELSVLRTSMATEGEGTQEWRSASLPRYAGMTRQVEALIAGAYLSGTSTRRVKRALAGEDVVRLIPDGTVVRVRLDRKATSILLLNHNYLSRSQWDETPRPSS